MLNYLAAAYTIRFMALREQITSRVSAVRDADPEDGSTAETAIIIAALALVAVGVVTFVGKAILAKAHSISLDTPSLGGSNVGTNP